MAQNQSPARPATQPTQLPVAQPRDIQIEVALNVIDQFTEIRQMAMCPETSGEGELTPKEEATYNAALDRLEKYLDLEIAE